MRTAFPARHAREDRDALEDFALGVKLLIASNGNADFAMQQAKAAGRGEVGELLQRSAADALGFAPPSGPAIAEAQALGVFIGEVFERSVLGRMPEVLKIPPNTKVSAGQVGGVRWTGQGKPVMLARPLLLNVALEPLQVAGASVFSKQVVEFSNVDFQALVIQHMIEALSEAVDLALLDPSNGGAAGVTPKSVTHGLQPVAATSNSLFDIKALVAGFAGDIAASYWVGRPATFAALAGEQFPDLGVNGGALLGLQALASRQAPAGTLVLLDGSALVAIEAQFDMQVSTQADIEMSDNPAAGPAARVSMFQSGLVAVQMRLHANWKLARAGSVAMIAGY